VDHWQTQLLATFNGSGPLDWSLLEGLAYTCAEESYLIRGGQALPLPRSALTLAGFPGSGGQALSPDGRYLAYVSAGDGEQPALFAYDLEREVRLFLADVTEAYLVGWSAGGVLVTLERVPSSSIDSGGLADYRAWGTDLAASERSLLTDDAFLPSFFGTALTWTPDRRSVLLNGYYGRPDQQDLEAISPVLLPVDDPGPPWRLPRTGYAGMLSPDGRRLAYTVPVPNDNDVVFAPVEVYDLRTGTHAVLLSPAALAAPGSGEAQSGFLLPLAWTPDGAWLLVIAASGGSIALLAVPAAGGEPVTIQSQLDDFLFPLLSPDGRFMAYVEPGQANAALRLLDLPRLLAGEPLEPRVIAAGVSSAAWSPDGSVIALAGAGGLRVLEPASGEMRWVNLQACDTVVWHAPGR
jgi:WD40 repeat protein